MFKYVLLLVVSWSNVQLTGIRLRHHRWQMQIYFLVFEHIKVLIIFALLLIQTWAVFLNLMQQPYIVFS